MGEPRSTGGVVQLHPPPVRRLLDRHHLARRAAPSVPCPSTGSAPRLRSRTLAAAAVHGRGARCVRPDRGGRWLGRRRDEDDRPARRRPLDHRRAKAFITNGGSALTEFVARHSGHRDASRWPQGDLVDPGAVGDAGVHGGPGYSKVGWNASDTRELGFPTVRVPEGNLVGERGRGRGSCRRRAGRHRRPVRVSPRAASTSRTSYAGQREAFGQPIGATRSRS